MLGLSPLITRSSHTGVKVVPDVSALLKKWPPFEFWAARLPAGASPCFSLIEQGQWLRLRALRIQWCNVCGAA